MDEPKRLSSEEKEYMDLRNQYIYLNKLVDNGFKNWCAGNRNGVGQLDLQWSHFVPHEIVIANTK